MKRTLLLRNVLTVYNRSACIKRAATLCLLWAIHFAVYSQAVTSQDVVAKWNFASANIAVNGSTTTVKDESGSNFTGTLMNDARIRTIGSSTQYNVLDMGNGTGYFDMGIGIGKEIYALSNYTMSAFFRIDSTITGLSSNGNFLWTFSNSADESTDKNGYICGSLRDQIQCITPGYYAEQQTVGKDSYDLTPLSLHSWHHVAYTQNGTTGTLYIDGVQQATGSVTYLPSVVLPRTGFTGTPFNWIGRSCYTGDSYLKKTFVYGFSLYKTALTADDIINYLDVPKVISYLNKAFEENPDPNPYTVLPDAAGVITGLGNVCQGQNTVTYSVPAIANADSYNWILPNGVTGTSITNSISVNYARSFTSGTITVKGYNNLGDGVPSSLAITTNPLPADAGIISGNTSVCACENQVTYAVPAIDNALSYTWTLPTGVTGTSATNSITVDYSKTAVSGNITVKGHNDCGDGEVSILPITVNQLPVILTRDTAVTCGGSVPLLPTINYSGNGTLKYRWTPATGLSNDTIAYPSSSPVSDITYTLTATTPGGCTVSKDIAVIVRPLRANAGTDKTANSKQTIQLDKVTTNYTGGGTLKYKWTPATGLNNDTIANPTSTVTGKITYTVTVITPNGCTATDTVFVSLIPLAKPVIGIVSINSADKNVVVWNKPVSTGIDSYNIYRETNTTNVYEKIGTVPYDSLSVYIDNQSTPDIKSNKYELSILDRNGLESALSDPHKTMHLTINKGMNGTWNLIWEPYEGFNVSTYNIYRGTTANTLNFLDATSGSSSQYSDTSAPSGDVYYQLEVISPTLVNPSKASSSLQRSKESGSSTATTLVSYNSSRSNIASNGVSGINDPQGDNNTIKIYPNPVRDELKIDFEGGTTFEILNLTGQVLYNGNLVKDSTVQLSALTPGVYLIKFKTGNTFEYKKIIKE